jgi:glycosyltransferase involved in cell wall biosynthesis
MLVLGLVKNEHHVCCRYRLTAFREHLAREGHVLELRAWPRTWLGRFLIRKQLQRADVVIVQRRLLAAWELLLVRRAAKRLVFDFDDAVFLRDSYAQAGTVSVSRHAAFARMVRAADLVVAGNQYLGETAQSLIGSARVCVQPTRVNPHRYPLATHNQAGPRTRLVWIGSASTLRGLERSADLWDTIGLRCPSTSFKIICDKPLKLQYMPVEFCPWSEATEGRDLADADIGVSWLPEDSWSRGKCGLKVLQFMAAGLPVIANPVGVQTEMIRHGETGFLAETVDEWCQAVRRLASDPALRRRMGQAGRRVVEGEYNVEASAALWTSHLQQLTRCRDSGEAVA